MEKKIPYSFINEADVMKRLGGNINLFNRLFIKYVDQCRGCDVKVQEMLAADQLEEAHLLVHNIKGISANMGVTCMWEASAELDKALKARDKAAAMTASETFYQALQQVLAEVDSAK